MQPDSYRFNFLAAFHLYILGVSFLFTDLLDESLDFHDSQYNLL